MLNKTRFLLSSFALFAAFGVVGASASDFSASQRKEIVQIVRQALQDDPTILTDAFRVAHERNEQTREQKQAKIIKDHWKELAESPDFAVRGNPKGSLTVVEFLDPRCGYCRKMLPEVKKWLARNDKVRFVERVLPILGESSVIGTKAVMAAGLQGRYNEMRDLCFAAPTLNEDTVVKFAQSLGLNVERFKADENSKTVKELIERNLELARVINLEGTPYFIFSPELVVPGGVSADYLERYAQAALKG